MNCLKASTESELVARLCLREAAACEELVRAYGPRMLATARRLLNCEHAAADAMQDAILSAIHAINRFDGKAQLSTWLHRIVVNAALMKRRVETRRKTVSMEEHLPSFDEQGRHVDRCSRWPADAFDAACVEEIRTIVRECIDLLPESYRTVVLLRDIESLDTEETARVLGESIGNVKTRLHRARQCLRSLLEARMPVQESI